MSCQPPGEQRFQKLPRSAGQRLERKQRKLSPNSEDSYSEAGHSPTSFSILCEEFSVPCKSAGHSLAGLTPDSERRISLFDQAPRLGVHFTAVHSPTTFSKISISSGFRPSARSS